MDTREKKFFIWKRDGERERGGGRGVSGGEKNIPWVLQKKHY